MKVRIKGGIEIVLRGQPVQAIQAANTVQTVGTPSMDLWGIRPDVLVAEGDVVEEGTALFRDRKRPQICFTAAVSGMVSELTFGAQRQLASLRITAGGHARRQFKRPVAASRDSIQALLLESGLWPSFVARPFGRIPDPGSTPDAVFVTALDTRPLAADASIVQAEGREDLARGVSCLSHLTAGPVFVCQAPGEPLVQDGDRLRCVSFDGIHPAGLAATHVNRLFPLVGGRTVWQVHYQDAMAMGALMRSGEVSGQRVVALAGEGVRRPRLVRIPRGADLDELVQGEVGGGAYQVLSGSPLGGRPSRYLGRHHWQVTVWPRPPSETRRNWPGPRAQALKPSAVIASAALSRSLALDLPVLPLVRALSVGDAETAARLGCLELLEEDMALVTYASGEALDLAALLRSALDVLEAAQ